MIESESWDASLKLRRETEVIAKLKIKAKGIIISCHL